MNKDYKLIETEDGSFTVHSPLYDEACHSTSGAAKETFVHYIEGCKIIERTKPIILEVGFGTGLGFNETLKYAKTPFHFISLEIDENMIEVAKKNYSFLDDLKQNNNILSMDNDKFKLDIIVGDARDKLKPFLTETNIKFNAIYQDAFSPKRNPILWTTEWFSLLFDNSADDCIMSTYSSSSSIRKSMIKAGWRLYEGERFGPKRSSTRAKKTGVTDVEILKRLERSPVVELTDKNSKEYKL